MIDLLRDTTGWEPPECPECGNVMLAKQITWEDFFSDRESNVYALFLCTHKPRSMPHHFSWEERTCVLCHAAFPYDPSPCPASEINRHPDIEFKRVHGHDSIHITIERYA